jgi:two-component system chemotaxis response regulator CheB
MVPQALNDLSARPRTRIEALVIGASAGAIDALRVVLAPLPASFPVPVVLVVHISHGRRSLLPEVLGAWCALPVAEPDDKQPVSPGIWVAPAGYHLLIEPDRTFSLSDDEPVAFSRPSIDVLFESAADTYGAALVCVVLTGANEDGAFGARVIRARGGHVIVQDPEQALYPNMPRAAIAQATPQTVTTLERIAAFLVTAPQGDGP